MASEPKTLQEVIGDTLARIVLVVRNCSKFKSAQRLNEVFVGKIAVYKLFFGKLFPAWPDYGRIATVTPGWERNWPTIT